MKFQMIFKNGRDVIFEAEDCVMETNNITGKTSMISFNEPKGTRPVWFRLEDVTAIVLIEEEDEESIDVSGLLRKEENNATE